MIDKLLMRCLVAVVFAGVFAWAAFTRYDGEIGSENSPSDRQRYLPYASCGLLPGILLVSTLLALCMHGWKAALELSLSLSFSVLVQICLYDLVLLAVLPLLRRWISARACAMLWMMPNYLYIANYSWAALPMPLWIIPSPGDWLWVLVGLWLAGVCLVLVWSAFSHLRFRRQILKPAAAVTDPAVLEIWRRELEDACFKKPNYRLVVSPAVVTPLSVGLFPQSIRVVLPDRAYTPEELSLILRHELIHIGRQDAWSKFFLLFCTALCWFNPLMWAARRKSAEDLELSCDETVLLQRDAATRRRYADLLLTTAGDERGFTTCLSATASSLRYRLRQIVAPRKKRSGALLVGLLFFALCMSTGFVALAYGGGTGQTLLIEAQGLTAEGLLSAKLYDNGRMTTDWLCPDRAALTDYLASLELRQLSGNYSFDVYEPEWILLYETPGGTLAVVLGRSRVRILPYEDAESAGWYYVPGGVDWNTLEALFTPVPALRLTFTGPEHAGEIHNLNATVLSLSEERNGRVTDLVPADDAPDTTPSGVFGYELDQVQLDFSRPLVSDIIVEILPPEGGDTEICTLSSSETTIALASYPARYRVHADMQGIDGSIYHGVFLFEVGDA